MFMEKWTANARKQAKVGNETGQLCRRESVLDVLEEEIRKRGFVGPADVPKLVFLCLQTRHFDRPVSFQPQKPRGHTTGALIASPQNSAELPLTNVRWQKLFCASSRLGADRKPLR